MAKEIAGWILIHRKLKEHWIWKDPIKFQWWMDILLTANHSDNKVLISGALVDCKRGQSVKSLESWAKDWRVTRKTVAGFFKLLEKDKMLRQENVKVSTRITVCNYDSYNDLGKIPYTAQGKVPTQPRENPLHTNNEGINNDNELKELKEDSFRRFWELYDKPTDKRKSEDKFLRLEMSDITKLLEVVPAYVRSQPDRQFRKNPLTWLNGRCWEDEIKTGGGGIQQEFILTPDQNC